MQILTAANVPAVGIWTQAVIQGTVIYGRVARHFHRGGALLFIEVESSTLGGAYRTYRAWVGKDGVNDAALVW
jgi:hypothetical protein